MLLQKVGSIFCKDKKKVHLLFDWFQISKSKKIQCLHPFAQITFLSRYWKVSNRDSPYSNSSLPSANCLLWVCYMFRVYCEFVMSFLWGFFLLCCLCVFPMSRQCVVAYRCLQTYDLSALEFVILVHCHRSMFWLSIEYYSKLEF